MRDSEPVVWLASGSLLFAMCLLPAWLGPARGRPLSLADVGLGLQKLELSPRPQSLDLQYHVLRQPRYTSLTDRHTLEQWEALLQKLVWILAAGVPAMPRSQMVLQLQANLKLLKVLGGDPTIIWGSTP